MTIILILSVIVLIMIFVVKAIIKFITNIMRYFICGQRDFIMGKMPEDEEKTFMKRYCLINFLAYWFRRK